MSSNLEQFMQRFVHANEQRSKRQHVQPKQYAQQIQKVNGSLIASDGNVITVTKAATVKLLSEDQYKASIIAKAIAYINNHKGVM